MKRVLYIASRFPYPITGGREFMVNQSLRALSSASEVDFVCFRRSVDEMDMSLPSDLSNVKCVGYLKTSGFLESLLGFLCSPLKPFQWHLYNGSEAKSFIKRLTCTRRYDLIVFDMLRTTALSSSVSRGVPMVLEMDDLLSRRYLRQTSEVTRGGAEFGAFGSEIANTKIGKVLTYLSKLILRVESAGMRRLEVAAPLKYDAVTLTSPKEAGELSSLSRRNNIFAFPPSFEVEGEGVYGPQSPAVTVNHGVINLVFIGNAEVAHNFASIKYIVDAVLPVAHGYPEKRFEFSVIGKPPRSGIDLVRLPSNVSVSFLGFVKYIPEAVPLGSILLCPVVYGSGIKLKILEGMRLGLPIVTNSIGSEGIPNPEGKAFVVEDDPVRMFETLVRLAAEPQLRAQYSAVAKSVFSNSFSLERNVDMYLRRLGLLNSGESTGAVYS